MNNPRLNEDLQPTFPKEDIICVDCLFRKNGDTGFRNRYCSKYIKGKPLEILFENAECPFYVHG